MKQTSKERKADHTAQERARQAGYERMQKAPPVKTWSATMPPYCYTSLCPVAELREPIRRGEKGGDAVGKDGTDPVHTH